MAGYTNISETKLAITNKLPLVCDTKYIVLKINELIDKINFLDEHINFLYDRSRTQYNTLVANSKGLKNLYDEFQEFKKRFETYEAQRNELVTIESANSTRNTKRLSSSYVSD